MTAKLNIIACISLLLPMQLNAEESKNGAGPQAMKLVKYEDFGAVGDGKTDDLPAIIRAHKYANQHRLPVRAADAASYYIGGLAQTAIIETDTDFGDAKFIIDDRVLEQIKSWVFEVRSAHPSIELEWPSSLKRGQKKLDVELPDSCVVVVIDSNVKHYIRKGANQNSGSSQKDVFLVDKNGKVDPDTAILWDFDQITDFQVFPVDEQTLTIRGGHFTTIANAAESKYNYHSRGIAIRRSNVLVEGLEHHVTGEGEQGAPYLGFINVANCSNVTIQNSVLTGRKTYKTIGNAGTPVSMGSYDLAINAALNVSIVNSRQTNDIYDSKFWGIMCSNYSKNLLYDGCVLSRFDAHLGVANAIIRNSILRSITLIGSGTFLIENTTVRAPNFISLREDYGSTWQGDFIIRNCEFFPTQVGKVDLIGGSNSGQHNFGYNCYLPEKVMIDTLRIHDDKQPENYPGPAIFADVNPKLTDSAYREEFPYIRPREVILKNVTTDSGLKPRISDNGFFFKAVVTTHEEPE